VGARKVPDAKALGRQARAQGPEVIKQIQRMVELSVENKVDRELGGFRTPLAEIVAPGALFHPRGSINSVG
jgi:hypothetical protein